MGHHDPPVGSVLGDGPHCLLARCRNFTTVDPCHTPPRSVPTPRLFNSSAIARTVRPFAAYPSMMGSTEAAQVSESATVAVVPLRCEEECGDGLPNLRPGEPTGV
jgi:hypothetical protein